MNTKIGTPKPAIRHHYIPQFYLKLFSHDNSRVYLLDKKSKDKKSMFRYQTTENIAYENNLYTYRTKSLEKETLEDFFCLIEDKANKIIHKLERREEILPLERGHLALFVAFLWLRTPTSRNETLAMQAELTEKTIRNMYHLPQQKELIKNSYADSNKQLTKKELDDLVDFATNPLRSEIKINFPPEYWIKQMLMLANDIYPYLAHCKWEIRHSVRKYAYITSDNPVLLIPSKESHPFYGIGLLTPGVKKTVPISSSMYLIMHEPQDKLELIHTIGDKDFYRKVNEWTMRNAERLVFASDLGKIEKMVITNPELIKPRGKTYQVS